MRADDVLDQIDSCLGDYELSDDAMRWSPEPPPSAPGARLDRVIDATAVAEQFDQLRRSLQALSEHARARLEEIGRSFQAVKEAAQQAGLVDEGCKPVRPRDRPAWQTPYGPPQRRR